MTNEGKLEKIAAIGGALALTGVTGQALCSKMYREGTVKKMYSESIAVRAQGYLEAIPYQVSWVTCFLPLSLIAGAAMGAKIGRSIKKLVRIA